VNIPLQLFFILLISALVVHSSTAHAQFDLPGHEPDSLGHRHSIGIYTSAAASTLMGGVPFSPRAGVIFRRQSTLNPHRTWRFQGVADFYDVWDDSDNFLSDILLVTDSSMVFRWKNDTEWRATGRIGIEWSDPREVHTPFYGIDLLAGVNRLLDQRGQVTFARDTLVQSVRPLASDPGSFLYTRDQEEWSYIVGVAFTAGYRFRIRDTWDVLFQMSPELYYAPLTDLRGRSLPGRREEVPPSSFWVQLRLVEMQVCRRF